MNDFKFLVDTNVIIGLEDAHLVQASFAELVRQTNRHRGHLFVDGAVYDDVERDPVPARRAVTLSKLAKFQKLATIPLPPETMLVDRFGRIRNEADRSDVRLLAVLDSKAVDFLITEDSGIHARAEKAGIASSVLTVEDALDWLRQSFEPKKVDLPYVEDKKAYEIDVASPLFSSIAADYPGFLPWFEKCKREHRDCWTLQVNGELAGIVIRKNEAPHESQARGPGHRILKICTFKVRDEYRGEKFGEQLLKKILWFAQRNQYDLTYLTVFPKQDFLIQLLHYYGFHCSHKCDNGELVLEKKISNEALPEPTGNLFDYQRSHYPKFYDGPAAAKFCVPIRPDYCRRLFPEASDAPDLPLFPRSIFGSAVASDQFGERTPGNTIRKVYLCRAKIRAVKSGDLLFFYMSKNEDYAASQSLISIGVVEQVQEANELDTLLKLTAKRSVFSANELDGMLRESFEPIRVFDFLLIGHMTPSIPLSTLTDESVFASRPPQSIATIPHENYLRLKKHINIGFNL